MGTPGIPKDPKPDIQKMDINEIKESGLFTPQERAAEYRRRGKSPSGVIDGVYNDTQRGSPRKPGTRFGENCFVK